MKLNAKAGEVIRFVKFSGSSLVTTGVDFTCFTLLYIATSNVVISNVCARTVSATLNFAINRNLIFKDSEDIRKTAVKFFASAAAILAVKTAILKVLVDVLGFNAYLSKGAIGIAFFLVNWAVQRLIVFAEPKGRP